MSLLDSELVVPNVDSEGEGNVEDIGVDLFGGSEDERDFYGFDSDGNDVDIVTIVGASLFIHRRRRRR